MAKTGTVTILRDPNRRSLWPAQLQKWSAQRCPDKKTEKFVTSKQE